MTPCRDFSNLRFSIPCALAAMLAMAAASAATESLAPPREVDPRWSLVYVLEGAADDLEPGPVTHHSSWVERSARAPMDSPDVAVLPSSNRTQTENSTAVDPNDPNVIFVSNNATNWPVSQVFGTGVYWSLDGGATWTGDDTGPGGVGNNGDPAAVIRGVDGRWAVGFISSSGGQGVSYTDNQGSTWQHRTVSSAGGLDKNHLEVDNSVGSAHYGNLYSSWVNLGSGPNVDNIEISRSTDGGDGWSAVQNISAGVGAGSHDQGVNIRIGPNGEVYVTWAVYDSWPSDETAIGLNKSTDGGASWVGEARVITNIRGHRNTSLPNTSIRRNSFPSMCVDTSGGPNDGAVYIFWTNIGVPGVNSGDADIYMAKSTDGGATFGTPVRVNQDATTNSQWFPWAACDPTTGQLAVVFYDRREDPGDSLTRTYMAVSNDGGTTWEDFAVGDVSFTPTPIPGLATGYMGDYLGMAIGSGRAYPTWSDNRSGNFLCYVSPILVSDPDDPNPPTDVTAFSDYLTPTSVQLDWTDPTTTAGGTPLGDFSIDILRDDVFVTNVDQGVETLTDLPLTDGQEYKYTLRAHDDVTDSTSIDVNVTVFAGGSPFPAPPTNIGCSADTVSATITWTNPTTQSDGTTLDDFAGLRIFRDGAFLIELARAPTDSGAADMYVDSPPPGFVYSYAVAAIDSEIPVNESAWAVAEDCFVGSVPNILVWHPTDAITTSADSLFQTLANLGESVILTDNLFEFSPDLNAHEIVFAVVGIFSDNHIINSTEGAALEDLVQDGGRLYLEGGDVFNYDPDSAGGYDVRPIFGLADGPDGSGDLFTLTGLNDLAGFDFAYAGGNNFIDELQPTTSSPVWQNGSNSDIVGVFKPDFGSGRSIGCSYEFGGLVDTGVPAQLVAREDVSGWLHAGGEYEEPLFQRVKASPERMEDPKRKRAANTQTWKAAADPRTTGGIGAAVSAIHAANTKSDVMEAYLMLFRATGDPVMVTSTTSLQSTIFQNETDTQFFSVSNPGSLNDDLLFTITEDPPAGWLVASPQADTLGANGLTQITVDFDASGLAPGTYLTDLVIDGNDPSNLSDTVSVMLDVLGIPDIAVTPDSLFFSLAPFVSGEDSVTVSNNGVGNLDYSLVLTSDTGAERVEFPSTASAATGGSRFRGNVYQIDATVPLKAIEHFFSISSATQLEFFIYENTAPTGTFTKIFSTTVTSGTGAAWYSSAAIDVTLQAGSFYFIGAGWLGSLTYYNNDAVDPLPAAVPFGSLLSSSGSNSYPPPATKSINGAGAIIWTQALEYGVPADLEILSPSSGTVPPSGSTVVNLRATGGPNQGIFDAQLHISSNDPDMGEVIVPITIEVTDATGTPTLAGALPTVLELHQSVPNPTHGSTEIRFDLPQASRVSLRIYSVTGRLVRTLLDRPESAGYGAVVWDGRDEGGIRVGSGVYFYSLQTENRVMQRKMILLR